MQIPGFQIVLRLYRRRLPSCFWSNLVFWLGGNDSDEAVILRPLIWKPFPDFGRSRERGV